MTITRYIAACNPDHLLMPIGTWERETRQGETLRPRLFERPEDAQAAGGGKEPIKLTITLSPPG